MPFLSTGSYFAYQLVICINLQKSKIHNLIQWPFTWPVCISNCNQSIHNFAVLKTKLSLKHLLPKHNVHATQMLYDLNPNGTFGCHACWVSKLSFLTPKHKRKRMAEWKSKEWQSMYKENPVKGIKNHRGMKDGVFFSHKSYAILRKYKVYSVSLPKTLTLFCFSSLRRFLLLSLLFAQRHSPLIVREMLLAIQRHMSYSHSLL